MGDRIEEPVFIAVLAHLEDHNLWLHVLDQVPHQLGGGGKLELLVLGQVLGDRELVDDGYCENLLLEVLELHHFGWVLQVLLLHGG